MRKVNREAFGSDLEAGLVDKLRSREAVAVSLVAVEDDEVIGYILFSTVTLESVVNAPLIAGLGPMSVLLSWQRKGIGSLLVPAGLAECK
ncbi:GNAT family N-acetyltransferase [Chloroflexota bacterium]